MFKSFLKTNSLQFRSICGSNLMVGRLDNPAIDQSVHSSSESREVLESHFSRQLKTHFGFDGNRNRQLIAICQKAFESHLKTCADIDRNVHLVANHFSADDVFFNPQIFAVNAKTLRNRVSILKEMAFNRLTIASSESCFRSLIQQSVQSLQRMGFIGTDVVKHLLSSARCPPHLRPAIECEIQSSDIESMSLEDIRRKAIAKYVSLKLNVSVESALKLFNKKSSRIHSTPMADIVDNIDLMCFECRMPAQRLLQSPNLLTVDSENVRRILETIDRIGGQPILEVCHKYPKLLDTECETLNENLALIRDNGFSDEQVMKSVLVLTLNSGQLSDRLRQFNANQDLLQWTGSDQVLQIVLQLKTALNRLDNMKASGFTDINIDYLFANRDHFNRMILGSGHLKCGLEFFVHRYLNCELSAIRSTVGSHPYEKRFNFRNACKVYEFLTERNVTNDQIRNGVFVVLYDCPLVKQYFRQLVDSEDKDWHKDPLFLQLLIYFIEKSYGFSGNAVFVSANKK